MEHNLMVRNGRHRVSWWEIWIRLNKLRANCMRNVIAVGEIIATSCVGIVQAKAYLVFRRTHFQNLSSSKCSSMS